jgi:hypothetical protein
MRRHLLCGTVCLVCALAGCATHHVGLKFPDATPGEEYTCHVTTSQVENCSPATKIDPAANNQAHTVFVILPRECKGHFHEVTIHDSGSSEPTVDVKCAPLENHIE